MKTVANTPSTIRRIAQILLVPFCLGVITPPPALALRGAGLGENAALQEVADQLSVPSNVVRAHHAGGLEERVPNANLRGVAWIAERLAELAASKNLQEPVRHQLAEAIVRHRPIGGYRDAEDVVARLRGEGHPTSLDDRRLRNIARALRYGMSRREFTLWALLGLTAAGTGASWLFRPATPSLVPVRWRLIAHDRIGMQGVVTNLASLEGVGRVLVVGELSPLSFDDVEERRPAVARQLTIEVMDQLIALWRGGDEGAFRRHPLGQPLLDFWRQSLTVAAQAIQAVRTDPSLLENPRFVQTVGDQEPLFRYAAAHPDVIMEFEQPPLLSFLYELRGNLSMWQAGKELLRTGASEPYDQAFADFWKYSVLTAESRDRAFPQHLHTVLTRHRRVRAVEVLRGAAHYRTLDYAKAGDLPGFLMDEATRDPFHDYGIEVLEPYYAQALRDEPFILPELAKPAARRYLCKMYLQAVLGSGRESYATVEAVMARVSEPEFQELLKELQAHHDAFDQVSRGRYRWWLWGVTRYVVAWLNDRGKWLSAEQQRVPQAYRGLTRAQVETELQQTLQRPGAAVEAAPATSLLAAAGLEERGMFRRAATTTLGVMAFLGAHMASLPSGAQTPPATPPPAVAPATLPSTAAAPVALRLHAEKFSAKIRLSIEGPPGSTVRLDAAETMAGPWTSLGLGTLDASGVGWFIDYQVGLTQRFYRAEMVSNPGPPETSVRHPDGSETVTTFDAQGQVLTTTHTTAPSESYDAESELSATTQTETVTGPDGKLITSTERVIRHDASGEVVSQWKVVTGFTYYAGGVKQVADTLDEQDHLLDRTVHTFEQRQDAFGNSTESKKATSIHPDELVPLREIMESITSLADGALMARGVTTFLAYDIAATPYRLDNITVVEEAARYRIDHVNEGSVTTQVGDYVIVATVGSDGQPSTPVEQGPRIIETREADETATRSTITTGAFSRSADGIFTPTVWTIQSEVAVGGATTPLGDVAGMYDPQTQRTTTTLPNGVVITKSPQDASVQVGGPGRVPLRWARDQAGDQRVTWPDGVSATIRGGAVSVSDPASGFTTHMSWDGVPWYTANAPAVKPTATQAPAGLEERVTVLTADGRNPFPAPAAGERLTVIEPLTIFYAPDKLGAKVLGMVEEAPEFLQGARPAQFTRFVPGDTTHPQPQPHDVVVYPDGQAPENAEALRQQGMILMPITPEMTTWAQFLQAFLTQRLGLEQPAGQVLRAELRDGVLGLWTQA